MRYQNAPNVLWQSAFFRSLADGWNCIFLQGFYCLLHLNLIPKVGWRPR